MKKKVGKVLPIIIGGLGVVVNLLGYYKDQNDRDELKEEIKKEILDEINGK